MMDRRDEIGDLARDLAAMTDELQTRMQATASFAADVSHEIKNPLTSLRSAVETIARIDDRDQQKKLMNILLEDVKRLDRLITDISAASRLDADLSVAEFTRLIFVNSSGISLHHAGWRLGMTEFISTSVFPMSRFLRILPWTGLFRCSTTFLPMPNHSARKAARSTLLLSNTKIKPW